MVPAVASFVLPLLAPVPPTGFGDLALRSRSSSATQCPRVLSIGDRPLVGNRPAIQILGSLEAACDDGAIAAVGLITLGRPADSFGLSERCLLGRRHLPHVAALGARSGRGADPHIAQSGSEIGAIKAVGRRGSIGLRGAASSNHTISTTQW